MNEGAVWGETTTVVATDVGLWMALPAIAPAFLLSAVIFLIVVRDRRRGSDDDEAPVDQVE